MIDVFKEEFNFCGNDFVSLCSLDEMISFPQKRVNKYVEKGNLIIWKRDSVYNNCGNSEGKKSRRWEN